MAGLCAIGQVLAALAMAPGLVALGARAAEVGAPADRVAPVAEVRAVDTGDGACVLPG
jgi:hypothetical protein